MMTGLLMAIRALPLAQKIAAGVALAALATFCFWGVARFIDNAFDSAEKAGKSEAVQEQQAAIIEQMEKAHDAEQKFNQSGAAGDAVRRDECLRHARNPENC